MAPLAAPSLPRVLVSGVDTLEVFTRGAVTMEWQERLSEAHHWAADGGKPVDLDVAGHRFKLQVGRSRIAPYMLSSEALTLHVNPWAVKGFPQVACELRSAFLWQHGARGALERARHLMSTVSGFAHLDPAVSRVDLAVDFQGWERVAVDAGTGEERRVAGFAPEDARRFKCRARQCDTHTVSGECTGFSFGAGGAVLARLYNKSVEIRTKSPDKAWFHDVWAQSPGWRAGEDVWRLEFQLRRRGWRTFRRDGEGGGKVEASAMLKEAGVGELDTFRDLEHAGRALWAYLSGRWLTVQSGKRTKKSSRRALDPAWAVINREGFAGPEWSGYTGDLTRAGRSLVLSRRSRAFAGVLAAEMAAASLDDPQACGDELIWGAVRRAELALEAKGTDLDTRAQERADDHRAAVAAIRDARRAYYTAHPDPLGLPPLPPPAPEPAPADLTPVQAVLHLPWTERGTGD